MAPPQLRPSHQEGRAGPDEVLPCSLCLCCCAADDWPLLLLGPHCGCAAVQQCANPKSGSCLLGVTRSHITVTAMLIVNPPAESPANQCASAAAACRAAAQWRSGCRGRGRGRRGQLRHQQFFRWCAVRPCASAARGSSPAASAQHDGQGQGRGGSTHCTAVSRRGAGCTPLDRDRRSEGSSPGRHGGRRRRDTASALRPSGQE